jgi:hypothetical protein
MSPWLPPQAFDGPLCSLMDLLRMVRPSSGLWQAPIAQKVQGSDRVGFIALILRPGEVKISTPALPAATDKQRSRSANTLRTLTRSRKA